MATILFLSVPSHGHVNPTLGLAAELVKHGDTVIYFATAPFEEKVKATGAIYRSYLVDLDLFGPDHDAMDMIFSRGVDIIEDIFAQTRHTRFDYIIHSTPFPFAKVIREVLQVPTVSSHAVFLGLEDFLNTDNVFPTPPAYHELRAAVKAKYGVVLPENIIHLLINIGGLNLVYSSRYFVPASPFFDHTFRFVGPPVFDRKESTDFPFGLLTGKKVIYISLGTVFGNFKPELYQVFFDAFGGKDVTVVMAAYQVDFSAFAIPDNVPFVAIPLGADQPENAARTAALGATIALDADLLTAGMLQEAVEKVLHDPAYGVNMKKISDSFRAAGGYPAAVKAINEYITG